MGDEMTVSIGPTVRRRRLGTELRRLREAHSIKLEEVAEQLGVAASTLSRIETGKAPTRSAYLTAMLEMYGVDDPGQRQVLIDMAREGHRKGWWAAYEDVLPTGFGIYVGLEAEAASLRAYESLVIHGLLQTEEYARAVYKAGRPTDSGEQIEQLVTARIDRQAVLERNDPPMLWAIIDECVLRRSVGGTAVMRGQLDRLIDAARRPKIVLQVVPSSAGAHVGLVGPFVVVSLPDAPEVVYLDTALTGQILERRADVAAIGLLYDTLRAEALSPNASAELFEKVRQEWT
jgi:transcriptional regulator with XRE-family HTH domain